MSDDKTSMPKFLQDLDERMQSLRKSGLGWEQAARQADLELRIRNWPSELGDNLPILIYGDFKPPSQKIELQKLGITIFPEPLTNTAIRDSRTVLLAHLSVHEKSISGINVALRKLNFMLGLLTVVDYGNGALSWYSPLIEPILSTASINIYVPRILKAYEAFEILKSKLSIPDDDFELARKKLESSFYWIRTCIKTIGTAYRDNTLHLYSSYWNVFECLVEATNIFYPTKPRNPKKKYKERIKDEKEKNIKKYLLEKYGDTCPVKDLDLTLEDVESLSKILNPSFKGQAQHAIKQCFKDREANSILKLRPLNQIQFCKARLRLGYRPRFFDAQQ